jgi:alkyl sulfatase BDS1-like metallo-beta-lactamase superfamily hydrolase
VPAADPIDQFFASLAEPGRISTFEGESASVRFDVGPAGETWSVQITDGAVAVSTASQPADAVVTIARRDLEAIVTGKLNAQAAILRGLLTCAGSIAAVIMFQRCLPGPPGSVGRVAPISSKTVTQQHARTA